MMEASVQIPGGRSTKVRVRTIAYWLVTLIIAYEMAAGSMWDLLRIPFVRAVMTHLGYPLYLLFILGAWKLPCAVTLLVPRFPRLKEWAYAGAFFNYTGAAASHLIVRDAPKHWLGPAIFGVLTMLSWALRPAERRTDAATVDVETPRSAWIISFAVAAAMVVVALLTLPTAVTAE